MSLPITVVVNIRIQPDRVDGFLQELDGLLPKIRQESACRSIVAHQKPDDPTSFLLIEIWDSREEFEEYHSGREYLREYLDRVSPWWIVPPDPQFWRAIDSSS